MTDAPPPAEQPDPRPRPKYGEYAPPGWVSPVQPDLTRMPPPAAPTNAPAFARPAAAWDRTLTIVLLVIGFFGAVIGWMTGAGLPESLAPALEQYGITPGPMPPWLETASIVITASHVGLYVAALAISVSRLRRGLRASWVPLAAGILAGIIFWSIMWAAVAPYASQLTPQ